MKTNTPLIKSTLHPRNIHRNRYDFEQLISHNPELKSFVFTNSHHIESIDFSNPEAVLQLNKALLLTYYGIKNWTIPKNYLCPPIPGRADYIHFLADLLAESNNGKIPEGATVQGLDIGVGSNCIYPIIGNASYGWHFVGSDIDPKALKNAKTIIDSNPNLTDKITLKLQTESRFIFKNVISEKDRFAFVICNPPFHKSAAEACKGTARKISNLNAKKEKEVVLNFGGQNNELWCEGGEHKFITQMIYESRKYANQCLWFTTLVSKKENLRSLYKTLSKVNAITIKTVEMAQGQKTSRFIAWTFLNETEHKNWKF